MPDQPYVVVVMLRIDLQSQTTPFAFRFKTEKAAAAAAEFWNTRGATAIIYDSEETEHGPLSRDPAPQGRQGD